jgi:hypothetical protein
MKKNVLTFGLISGAISAVMMLVTVPFVDKIGWEKGEILGYTSIVLAALLIFFGIRSYGKMLPAAASPSAADSPSASSLP